MKATSIRRKSSAAIPGQPGPIGRAVLMHDERHLRRRAILLQDGSKLLVDLPETVVLDAGDFLVVEGMGEIEISASIEPLLEIAGRDYRHLLELAWHIGNRHLAASIEESRIVILADHVIKQMLLGLGAQVKEIQAEFNPVRGAYSGHGEHVLQTGDDQQHDHDHFHDHDHDHDHQHSHAHEHGHKHDHDHSHGDGHKHARHD